ncbi:PLAC8-domain-containing protein [Daldinia loculata]|uniref:PLAC8-domain-containing protein n=1 Tax=Daldinia loculata TaxID=103429 RepID=UPI0020C1D33C|nr:PLAC8-domain-containing protein [Daldinia loculata]KAI1650423.1 PLAC8-domain-containing protein [Daldinia loculata]
MDSQEKYVYTGPEYPQGSNPQYQMQPHPQGHPQAHPQAHPQVGAYVHPHEPQQPQAIPREAYGQQGGEWQASLCDCSPCSSCLLAWCLPCLLLGQTSERIRDPSMQTADMMNSDCMIHGLITCFTGCGWIYGMLKRTEIRERYNIKGSGCDDCCVSFWCSCCALIQQDNEVKIRQQNAQPIAQGYQPQPGMQMPAPAHAPQH